MYSSHVVQFLPLHILPDFFVHKLKALLAQDLRAAPVITHLYNIQLFSYANFIDIYCKNFARLAQDLHDTCNYSLVQLSNFSVMRIGSTFIMKILQGMGHPVNMYYAIMSIKTRGAKQTSSKGREGGV